MLPINEMYPTMVSSSVSQVINTTIQDIGTEDPFYVLDVADILRKHKKWQQQMPRVSPFYAVKCNPSPAVLQILAALGLGFDCASKGEIDTILSLGVRPQKIIYANPCKTKSFIRHAYNQGVDFMTFDNEPELLKVSRNHPHAKMILRIKVDDSHSVCKFSAKFGAETSDASKLMQSAKDYGLDIVGVSFHVGSGCESAESFRSAIMDARYIFDLGTRMGFHMNILDLGGGWPGTADAAIPFEDMARVVRDSLDTYFPHDEFDHVNIIAEPGRYYVASAFTLSAMVIAKRPMITPDGEDGAMYYINDGVYSSFNCIIFDHVQPKPEPLLSNGELMMRRSLNSTIWGPTCDSMDLILKDIQLPEMEVGEWFTFKDMGAYTMAAASQFNGFKIPDMKYCLSSHSLESLRHLNRWPMVAAVLGVQEDVVSSDSEGEDFLFDEMDNQLIAVH